MRVLVPASSLPYAPGLVSTVPSRQYGTLSYPCDKVTRPSFGGPLNPDHSRRIHAGRVSYYALFKGMAASKPTSSLSRHGHILRYTERPLRGLSCGSGFFPSRRWTLSLSDCLPRSMSQAFGVWLGLVPATPARAHPVALPPAHTSRGSTSIDFGENQLSPGLIGLSPLPTSHPSGFQPTPVRSSTACYDGFNLTKGRSPRLRVYPHVRAPYSDSLSLRLRLSA